MSEPRGGLGQRAKNSDQWMKTTCDERRKVSYVILFG